MTSRLHNWCLRHGADAREATATAEAVVSQYRETHRHYHNLDHIRSSLECLDQLDRSEELIEGAIWFHDVIYDPGRSDNEAESALYFQNATSAWLDSHTQKRTSSLIHATDPGSPRSDDPLEMLMVDIDLTILGADRSSYDSYRRAIRREYGHVPEPDFKRGRAKVLERFLAGKIYLSPDFQHLEQAARQNITAELGELADLEP